MKARIKKKRKIKRKTKLLFPDGKDIKLFGLPEKIILFDVEIKKVRKKKTKNGTLIELVFGDDVKNLLEM